MENKKQTKKGLSDKELAAKYEAGRFEISKVLKQTFKQPTSPVSKAHKQK